MGIGVLVLGCGLGLLVVRVLGGLAYKRVVLVEGWRGEILGGLEGLEGLEVGGVGGEVVGGVGGGLLGVLGVVPVG